MEKEVMNWDKKALEIRYIVIIVIGLSILFNISPIIRPFSISTSLVELIRFSNILFYDTRALILQT